MTSPNDNDKNNDNKDKNDGVREKIDQAFASYASDLLKKIIKPDHWEKLQKLNTTQRTGIFITIFILCLVSFDLTSTLIYAFVWGYVLWTEKPWDESSFKTFVVYRHPTGELQAVKQGWSWPATGFIFIWALIKKMWVLGISLTVLFFFACATIVRNQSNPYHIDGFFSFSNKVEAVVLLVSVVFGILGNFWYEKKLLAEGFQRMNVVTAKNQKGALAAYLNQVDDKK